MLHDMTFPVIAGVEITTDEYGRFNLNALHRASGGEKKNGPTYWLTRDSTQKLIDEVKCQNTGNPVFTAKGRKGGTFAHELLAISYAGWISPAFQLKVNQVFIDYRMGLLSPPEPAPKTRPGLEYVLDQIDLIKEVGMKMGTPLHKIQEEMALEAGGLTFMDFTGLIVYPNDPAPRPSDRDRRYREKNREKIAAKKRTKYQEGKETLSDAYITHLLTQNRPLRSEDVTHEMIEAKRKMILLEREAIAAQGETRH